MLTTRSPATTTGAWSRAARFGGDPLRVPAPGTVFLSQNWKFTAPVYIDDTTQPGALGVVTGEAEVLSVHATKPVTQLRMTVKRADGEIAHLRCLRHAGKRQAMLEGEAWCYTFTRQPSG